jgi:hypothetical protein
MRELDEISKDEVKDYLAKGWLTHDGMWFYNTYRKFGIDTANKLNKEAVKSMAPFEAERTKKVLGMKNRSIDSFSELKELLLKALELVLPRSTFGRIHFSVPSANTIRWEWENQECFAYKGMERIGIADKYKCAVIYRIECWLNALGVKHTVNPVIENCLMAEKGRCSGDLIFYYGI